MSGYREKIILKKSDFVKLFFTKSDFFISLYNEHETNGKNFQKGKKIKTINEQILNLNYK